MSIDSGAVLQSQIRVPADVGARDADRGDPFEEPHQVAAAEFRPADALALLRAIPHEEGFEEIIDQAARRVRRGGQATAFALKLLA
jgi:hypothetical protein